MIEGNKRYELRSRLVRPVFSGRIAFVPLSIIYNVLICLFLA